MPSFQVLHIIEHVSQDVERIDNRLLILYDVEEEGYYYYGTRNDSKQSSYNDYKGFYPSSKLNSFINFLQYILGNFEEVLTTELHIVNIYSDEYDNLNYNKISEKCNKRTLLSAYDMNMESKYTIDHYVSMLDNSA
jgi:hypothetical protein